MRRRQLAAVVIAIGVARVQASPSQPVVATVADRITLPPTRREFESPSGRYLLAITSDDGWQTRRATGALHDRSGKAPQLCWRQPLPQTQGPRHVLLTDDGAAVLIDDWINVASPQALVLIRRDGRLLASYSIDALIAQLGVPRRTVAQQGRLGIWLSATPVLSADGSQLRLASGGRQLILQLADGALSVTD